MRNHLTKTHWPPWKVCVLLFCYNENAFSLRLALLLAVSRERGSFDYTFFPLWKVSLAEQDAEAPAAMSCTVVTLWGEQMSSAYTSVHPCAQE